jgi:hypothetical protein
MALCFQETNKGSCEDGHFCTYGNTLLPFKLHWHMDDVYSESSGQNGDALTS